ncbi:hypothetical protein CBW65_14455 [Tumebacillus avium]|uniref:Tetratricopeptide repeat protein n=1 Tax=Tumebacillus avium TaxID=1903704 RepID=A0A1Y0IRJ6_9BACL|nr:tetratricopeptide repeat protein [Tumebacillus avium]ARU62075.1 hypothetical protein CBW65_14455 [Tumebacillus avium]
MQHNELLKEIRSLCGQNKVFEVEGLLEEALTRDKTNIDLWLRLARLQLDLHVCDYEKCLECLDHAHEADPGHPYPLLLMAYVHEYYFAGIDSILFHKLMNFAARTEQKDVQSMLVYMASWHCHDEDGAQREKMLRDSIVLYPDHAQHYLVLSWRYDATDRHAEALEMKKLAFPHIRAIDDLLYENWDCTDYEALIDEHIRGTLTTKENYDSLFREVNGT